MPGFAIKQFHIAQQDNTNLATETYMSSKKTHHSVFQSIRTKKFLEDGRSAGYNSSSEKMQLIILYIKKI